MNDPTDDHTAPHTAPVTQPPEKRHANDDGRGDIRRERQAENRRKWAADHPERVRDMNRLWRAEHLEQARQQNRESMRRAAARRRHQEEVRARGRERAKLWREEHPRDEVNARATARRDADPERTKQVTKAFAERNKERRAEWQRTRRSDPGTYQAELEANAGARRRKRTLSHLGLPPKNLHPATAAERRTNEREADVYFSDPTLPEHLRQLTVFGASLTEHMLAHGARMREFAAAYTANRARVGLPHLLAENIAYARAVEVVMQRMRRVDLLTSRDVAAVVRSTQAEVPRVERQQQFDGLVKAVVTHAHRNRERLGGDAALENRARAHQGKPPISTETLIVQLSVQNVLDQVPTGSLTLEDARNAARIAGLHLAPSQQDASGTASKRLPQVRVR